MIVTIPCDKNSKDRIQDRWGLGDSECVTLRCMGLVCFTWLMRHVLKKAETIMR